jgi:hypothetical protein
MKKSKNIEILGDGEVFEKNKGLKINRKLLAYKNGSSNIN